MPKKFAIYNLNIYSWEELKRKTTNVKTFFK